MHKNICTYTTETSLLIIKKIIACSLLTISHRHNISSLTQKKNMKCVAPKKNVLCPTDKFDIILCGIL